MGKRAQPDDGRWDFQESPQRKGRVPVDSIMPNEANCRSFGAKHRGRGEKRTQSNPIPPASNGLAVLDGQIRRTKCEIRNKSQARNRQSPKRYRPAMCPFGDLRIRSFGLVSGFDARISCFPPAGERSGVSSIAPNKANSGVFGLEIGIGRESKANQSQFTGPMAGGFGRWEATKVLAIGLNLGYIWD